MNKKQINFDQKVQKELHFPISFHKPKCKTQEINYKQTPKMSKLASEMHNQQIIQSDSLAHIINIKAKNKSYRSRIHTSVHTRNTSPIEPLPPLIKSIPLHLDPKFQFPKKKKSRVSKPKIFHIEKIKSLITKIDDIVPTNKNTLNAGIRYSALKSQHMYTWVERLCESNKFGIDETLDGMIILHKDNMRLDKSLKQQSQEITIELNENALIMMKNMHKSNRRSISL
ncbi:hypothetical protein SteCoe_12802 [Stentor coeruleus]|uniref:Uncharacterized protein n=1 Tax=Stentor coeruleus TaxID=5963 RepID=A0A1R2C9X9_9CILI|nr:hypothetical protein SteCoe_12802 [Stentor coeruleus]